MIPLIVLGLLSQATVTESKGFSSSFDEGLVAYYKFDTGSGNIAYDSSGYGNDGLILGATWTEGVIGKALDFDGENDYVRIPHSEVLNFKGVQPFTLGAWIRSDDAQGDKCKPIIHKPYLLYFDHVTPQWRSVIINSDGIPYSAGHVQIDNGRWTHFAGVYDPPYMRAYVDGEEVAVNNVGYLEIDSNTEDVLIGASRIINTKITRWFDGIIDDVRIYNRALSSIEINTLSKLDWWNTDWKYRRRVYIIENSGYSLTNFPVEVTFEHYGYVQSDLDDVRVVVNGEEIPSYVSDLNGILAKAVFEVNVSAFSTETIYLYYGNPDATKPNYPLVALTISEGPTGFAIIDNSIFLGWDYTQWGGEGTVQLWNEFRIDFDGDRNPTNNNDLIRDWDGWQGGIGRRYNPTYGLGDYEGYTQTPLYVDIYFAEETLRVYRNNHWVETTQADFLRMFSPSYDYMKYGRGTEMNIVDGNTSYVNDPSCSQYYSKLSPGWMAYRDSASGIVFASTGLNIDDDYEYGHAAKEFPAWDRDISYHWPETLERVTARSQPSDCRIYWYGDNRNTYSNIERTAQILNNQPIVLMGTTLNEGLVAYYKFDTGSGNRVYDYSGNNHDGTIIGASWTQGKFGNALSFDGIDDYVDCGLKSLGVLLEEATTYTFWLKTSQTKAATVGDNGVRLMGSENDGRETTLLIEPNVPELNKFNIILKDDNHKKLGARLKHPFDFTGTGWHHVAIKVTPKTNNVDIYIDGVPRSVSYYHQESPSSFSRFQYPFVIGAGYCAGVVETFYEGLIDEVRIYNRALNEAEIRLLSDKAPNVLGVYISKNYQVLAANITVLDESQTLIGSVTGYSSYSWILDAGIYYLQASITNNDFLYWSDKIEVNVEGYTDVVINFPFNNFTISFVDIENQPLEECITVLMRENEVRSISTNSSGLATIEAYYDNWAIEAYWMNVPVGEEHVTINQSELTLNLQCTVGDLTVIAVDPFGNPVEADISLTNEAYDLSLSDHHYTANGRLTFSQIPLLEYNLTITGDFDTQNYQVNVDQTRQIQIETLPLPGKVIFIVIGLVIGIIITVLGKKVLAKRTKQTTITDFTK